MSGSASHSSVVLELAEEFLARCRRGERPSLTEYTDQFPDLAAAIREVFPAMALVEQVAVADSSLAGNPTEAADAAAPDPAPLAQLGDYRIIREVGRGGMGVVYEAEQLSLGRHVALKVLPGHGLLNPTYLERFRREAKAAARLHHTNIVPVFGTGEVDGTHFYAMQFIRGEGLDRVLDDLRRLRRPGESPPAPGPTEAATVSVARSLAGGSPEPAPAAPDAPSDRSSVTPAGSEYFRSVARIGVQAADALAYAHRQGILHRDIKPSNLLLDTQGTVWVTDFGLAKADGDDLTHTGDIVGTIRYMAPERFDGSSLPESDVYSLGLTLYELLTLRPAFEAANRAKLIEQVLREPPPRPRKVDTQVPRDLETVVLKCLAKDPKDRYPTADALAEDLRRFLADRTIRARRATVAERVVRWARRNPAVAALLAAVLVSLTAGTAVSVAFALRADRKAREAEEAARRLSEKAYVTDMQLFRSTVEIGRADLVMDLLEAQRPPPGRPDYRHFEWRYWWRLCAPATRWARAGQRFENLALSPDGRRLVVCGDAGVGVWDAETGRETLTFPGHPPHPLVLGRATFTPDGKVLSTAIDGPALLWDPDTGTVEARLDSTPDGGARPVACSPDGRWLAVGGLDGARVFDARTRQPRWTRPAAGPSPRVLQFSPDGRQLALWADDRPVVVVDVATGREVAALDVNREASGYAWALAFSPDGRRLGVGGTTAGGTVWDVGTWKEAARLADSTMTAGLAFLPADGGVVGLDASGFVKLWDADTGALVRSVPAHRETSLGLALASDGRRILTAGWDGVVAAWDLAGRGDRLTGHRSQVTAVAASLDGRTYASAGGTWDHTAGGRYAGGELKLWDAAAGRAARDLISDGPGMTAVAFAPDGRLLAAGTGVWGPDGKYVGGRVTLWDPATGTEAGRLDGHKSTVLCLAFSPDGRSLVTGALDGTVIVWDVAGRRAAAELPPQPPDVRAVAFGPDGRLVLSGGTKGVVRVWDLGRSAEAVSWDTRQVVSGIAVSPDGGRAVVTTYNANAAAYDPATGERLFDLKGHRGSATAVVFSPDGARVATASEDKTVRVWVARTGQEILTLKGHTDIVRSVSFTGDGYKLVSGAWDRTVRVWDATPLAGD